VSVYDYDTGRVLAQRATPHSTLSDKMSD